LTAADRPLAGRRVVITRSREQAPELARRLEALGATVYSVPTIRFAPPEDTGPLDRAIADLDQFDWVVFTSPNGVRFFWERLAALGFGPEKLAGPRVAAIGPGTAAELTSRIPDALGDIRGRRIFLPRTDIAGPELAEALRSAGAEVVEAVAYRTLTDLTKRNRLLHLLEARKVDAVTLTSASTARGLAAMVGPDRTRLEGVKIICIGPVTARAAAEAGLKVDVVASEHTLEGLVRAVLDAFQAIPKT
jgi:uroporphyrinogen-III synthase